MGAHIVIPWSVARWIKETFSQNEEPTFYDGSNNIMQITETIYSFAFRSFNCYGWINSY